MEKLADAPGASVPANAITYGLSLRTPVLFAIVTPAVRLVNMVALQTPVVRFRVNPVWVMLTWDESDWMALLAVASAEVLLSGL